MNKTQWADKAAIPEVPSPSAKRGTSDQPEDKPVMPPPIVLPIGALELPPKDDPNELLKHRYLCRGSGMLVVGPTGIGKSTFTMQAALLRGLPRK